MDTFLADYFTLKEAAEVLKKSTKQVTRYIQGNRLPGAQKIGLIYYIPRVSVEAMLAQPVQIEDTLTRRVRKLEDQMAHHLASHPDSLAGAFYQKLDEMTGQILELQSQIAELRAQIQGDDATPMDKTGGHRLTRPTSQVQTPVTASQEAHQSANASDAEQYWVILVNRSDLPQNVIPIWQLAKDLGMDDAKPLRDFVKRWKLSHYGVRRSPRDIDRFVTPEQEAVIREQWRIHKR